MAWHIQACQEYSSIRLGGQLGEIYRLSADKDQRWKDWFISTSPNGYFNPLATLLGMRLRGAACFCLCASYGESMNLAFPIGSGPMLVTIEKNEPLTFFANDTEGFYSNNKGSIRLEITRLR